MKKIFKVLASTLCAAAMVVPVFFTACGEAGDNGGNGDNKPEWVDYASQLTLDLTSETKKQEVTVRMFIDGDTTHFDPVKNSNITPNYDPNDFAKTDGYIKARYLAINTPESTGKIEEWGKTASNFTHDKLASADAKLGGSIIIESDNDQWNKDSTGERYTLWVWYRPAGETEYRNLNVEILQEGLAIASSTSSGRYGAIADAALEQAKVFEKHIFSNEIDENFYYGDAMPVTLKELRCHMADYNGIKVRVTGVVTCEFDNSVYIEEYDPDTGIYFGMAVFYGYTTGPILDVLMPGNKVEVVGSVTEFNGTYQISGVSHNEYAPDPSQNTIIKEDGYFGPAFAEANAYDIVSGKINVDINDETVQLAYGEAIMSTTVTVNNLYVKSVYTTSSTTDSNGDLTLTCEARDEDGNAILVDGKKVEITVRTSDIRDESGAKVKASLYNGKTINVQGLIDYYNGYQVKCYRLNQLTIVG